jgi:hypothetical protein
MLPYLLTQRDVHSTSKPRLELGTQTHDALRPTCRTSSDVLPDYYRQPLLTDEIRSLMKTRDKWRKLARNTNNPLHWSGYKTCKREVKRELRLAEREFVAEQIKNNPNNTRCLWKTIRSCIPNKSTCQTSFTKDDVLVANEFNTFFSSIGQTTIEKIKSLADECKYDLTKSVFIPRT